MSRPLVYTTAVTDASLRLPIAVIDSTALPPDGSLPDVDSEVPALIRELPASEFVIVYFSSRAPRTLHMNWMRTVYAMLSHDLRKRVKKIYVVHARWFTRQLNRALAPLVSTKFARKLHFANSLADLAREMDITAMDISPKVYLDDLAKSNAAMIPVPKQTASIFGAPLTEQPNSYWRAALEYLRSAPLTESHFAPAHRADADSAALAEILYHAVSREQRLRLHDYGPFAVLAVVKDYLVSLPAPLVRFENAVLPIHDTHEYTARLASDLPTANLMHLKDLIVLFRDQGVDPQCAAKSLGAPAMGLVNPSRDEAAVAARVFRNLMEFWPQRLGTASPASSLSSTPSPPPLPKRRGISELVEELSIAEGPMPRSLPSEIVEMQKRVLAPNRKAYGKVAQIVRVYNDVP